MMNNEKGFTLVEGVTAAFLLAVFLSVLIFSFASARMYVTSARHRYQAISLARERLEDIIQTGTLPVVVGDFIEENVIIDPDPANPAIGLIGTRRISHPVAQTIDITVSWTERMWGDVDSRETIILNLFYLVSP